MVRILIVEDDRVIAERLREHLARWGWEPRVVEDFSDVTGTFVRTEPHLVLMDIGLPFYDGYHWCTQIRALSQVPVVFLSSASDNLNIVMAVQTGGDDFITKPFDLSVLSAKIQAILRRAYDYGPVTPLPEHRGAVLHPTEATLVWQGERIPLTRNELGILNALMERRGAVVPRGTLMKKLWESDLFVDDNTLNVNIARLRKKLEDIGLTRFIETRKGLGYCLGDA